MIYPFNSAEKLTASWPRWSFSIQILPKMTVIGKGISGLRRFLVVLRILSDPLRRGSFANLSRGSHRGTSPLFCCHFLMRQILIWRKSLESDFWKEHNRMSSLPNNRMTGIRSCQSINTGHLIISCYQIDKWLNEYFKITGWYVIDSTTQ
jgi:hypothetical protein